jgi:hypothetical protein
VNAEPVVYREEVLTIMGFLGDIRAELQRSTSSSEAKMARKKKKKKMTPEERAELAEFRRRSDENLQRLRELVERGWTDLRAKRAAGYHLKHPAWGPPPR